jgi:hypothetical protein
MDISNQSEGLAHRLHLTVQSATDIHLHENLRTTPFDFYRRQDIPLRLTIAGRKEEQRFGITPK